MVSASAEQEVWLQWNHATANEIAKLENVSCLSGSNRRVQVLRGNIKSSYSAWHPQVCVACRF
eukprot:6099338-Amphidinium_carterae.3